LHAVRRNHDQRERIVLIVTRREAGTVGLREPNAAVRRRAGMRIAKLDQDQVACFMDRHPALHVRSDARGSSAGPAYGVNPALDRLPGYAATGFILRLASSLRSTSATIASRAGYLMPFCFATS